MMTNKTQTLDDLIGLEQAADFQREIDRFVNYVVSQFFGLYRSITQSSIPQLTTTQISSEPKIREESQVIEQPKHVVSQYKLKALQRGFYLEIFSAADIAYFLDLPKKFAMEYFRSLCTRPRIKNIAARVETMAVTYKEASQIYEAYYDADKERQEIAKSIGIHVWLVSEAILKRHIIQPRIIEALRVLYNLPKLDKPYKVKF